MKIFIQTKSGNFNTTHDAVGFGNLEDILKNLRKRGGFESEDRRESRIFVPFEEIEFIRKAKEGD